MFDFLAQKFSTLFSGLSKTNTITQKEIDQTITQIKEGLLEADVPYQLVETFAQSVNDELIGQKNIQSLKPAEHIMKIVHDKLVGFLGDENNTQLMCDKRSILMVMGLQGSGKTTTISKLAYHIKKHYKAKRILVGSVDFYRPAAIDQLEQLAQKVNIDFYRANATNPVEAAQELQTQFSQNNYDILILDTAGRLHVDNQMLTELQKINTILQPNYSLLVLDSMTGQESLNVAKAFDQAVGFHGAILSKMDSDTRGGAAFSFRYALKKPIMYIGTGEKPEDLDRFYPERIAGRMLGMGDMKSLLERADARIKQQEQKQVQHSFESGNFTLDDFAKQMGMMNKLGSISSLIKYIPGMSGMNIPPEALEQGEKEMKRFKAIIGSMTLKERVFPAILNHSRKLRVARGAGVEVAEVNKLIQRFEQMKQYAKLVQKPGGLNNIFKRR